MSEKRAQYSSEFKAKLALAAIRGEESISWLAVRHNGHPLAGNGNSLSKPPSHFQKKYYSQ